MENGGSGNGLKRYRAYSRELSPEMCIKEGGGVHARDPTAETADISAAAACTAGVSRFYHSRRVGQRLGRLWSPDQQAHKAAPSVVGLCPPPPPPPPPRLTCLERLEALIASPPVSASLFQKFLVFKAFPVSHMGFLEGRVPFSWADAHLGRLQRKCNS